MGRLINPYRAQPRDLALAHRSIPVTAWPTFSVGTAIRLIVAAVSLAGIVAMHGLSMTDVAGAHQDLLALSPAATNSHGTPAAHSTLVSDMSSSPATVMPGQQLEFPGGPAPMTSDAVGSRSSVAALDHAADHGGHGAMTGCVAILLGLISIAALTLRSISRSISGLLSSTRCTVTPTAARAPPQPIFLSLCVFRT